MCSAAAVADYRPLNPNPRKIKKDDARLAVSLVAVFSHMSVFMAGAAHEPTPEKP